jgi:hypothetical protein
MKFTSQIVSAASGSIGGCTYSRNRYGSYIRNRSVPVNPSSTEQQAVRSALATIAQAWASALTAAERDAWDAYAAAVPRVDALGNSQFVLGINWYVAINVLRLQSSIARLDAAPSILTGSALSPITMTGADADAPEITFTHTVADEWNADGGYLFVFTSHGTNPSRTFFKGPFRLADAVIGDTTTPIASPYTAPAAFVSAAGQQVWARFIAMAPDGRLSAPQIKSFIAT